MDVPVQAQRANLPFLCLLVLFRPPTDWLLPACIGEGDLLYSSLLILMSMSSGNTLTDTPRNHVFPASWASLTPDKVTHKINHHKSTPC